MKVAGADVWKGRWIVVVLDNGHFDEAFVAPTIDAAIARIPDAAVVGVDMPIGLPDPGQQRPADVLARKYVGPRWQSVFLTPSLDLLQAESHSRANELARANGFTGISAQAYALKTTILQVQPTADRDSRVYEVHPEVSFVRSNASAHLPCSKTSWNGFHFRRQLLLAHGIDLPDELALAGTAGIIDVLDAAIVAWSAGRIASGEGESLPDGSDRVGAIWR